MSVTVIHYWPLFCVILPNSVYLGATYVKVVEDFPIISAKERSTENLVFDNI